MRSVFAWRGCTYYGTTKYVICTMNYVMVRSRTRRWLDLFIERALVWVGSLSWRYRSVAVGGKAL